MNNGFAKKKDMVNLTLDLNNHWVFFLFTNPSRTPG